MKYQWHLMIVAVAFLVVILFSAWSKKQEHPREGPKFLPVELSETEKQAIMDDLTEKRAVSVQGLSAADKTAIVNKIKPITLLPTVEEKQKIMNSFE